MRFGRSLGGALVVAAILAEARPASADHGGTLGQVDLGIGFLYTPKLPSLSVSDVGAFHRKIEDDHIDGPSGLLLPGFYGDTALVVDGQLTIPLFGFSFYAALGPSRPVVDKIDGSIAVLRPWTTVHADFLLPGLGLRATRRRWLVGAELRTGASFVDLNGKVADGATLASFSASGVSFLFVGQVEACRRLDPEERICIEVSPRIYDFGLLNGATVGLRYELGR